MQKRKAVIKQFEKQGNIKSYLTEEGEDATSGWYYIFYYNTKKLLKIRVIWNGGCCQSPMLYDLYYNDSSLVLMDEFKDIQETVDRKNAVANLIKGKNLHIQLLESLMYKQQRLIGYINNDLQNPTLPIQLTEREKWGLEWAEMKNNFDYTKIKKLH